VDKKIYILETLSHLRNGLYKTLDLWIKPIKKFTICKIKGITLIRSIRQMEDPILK